MGRRCCSTPGTDGTFVEWAGGPAPDEANLKLVLVACALAMFATNLDFFALNLAIPGMARELDVSTTDMQWAISGYLLALGAFLIPGGRLGDLVGRRRMLILGTRCSASPRCSAAWRPRRGS